MIGIKKVGEELWVFGSHSQPLLIQLSGRVHVVHDVTREKWVVYPSFQGPSINLMECRIGITHAAGWYEVWSGLRKVGMVLANQYCVLVDGKVRTI